MMPPLPPAWAELLSAETRRAYFRELDAFVAAERAAHPVYPAPADTFAALEFTAPERVKAVILGQDPYHGEGQAHGLSFSVQPGVPVPPSLRNILRERHDDLGLEPPGHGCLRAWARRGVLLLNAVLTVRGGAAGSHRGRGWERFTDALLEAVAATRPQAVFLLWGNEARTKRALLGGRHVLEAPHPSPLSAHRGFLGSRPFSQCNARLTLTGEDPIDWSLPAEPADA